ncbi:nuclease SbcCD subunit C [Clostridiales bacterium]|nr:nuclease SbcCD subunit C [Clostridiales bacterium]
MEIVKNYSRKKSLAEDSLNSIETELNGRSITDEEFLEINNSLKDMTEKRETASNSIAIMEKELEQLKQNLTVVEQLKVEKNKLQRHHDMIVEISRLTEGNKLVEYMAESRLEYIAADASMRLKSISGGRYALELLAGEFIIRDDFCGGIRRRPTTLSGGETFLTSFALALALSDRIQMKNRSSLKFFFLDEGFGTLDKNSLDTVMKSLEVLCRTGMTVGLITHVEEVKERLMVKLNVDAAIPGKSGSTVSIKY